MKERTRFQEFVFSLMMSFVMAYAMEFYNHTLMVGGRIDYHLFGQVFKEVWWLTIIVYVIQTFWGIPMAKRMCRSVFNPAEEKPYVVTFAMGISTVLVMCPTMSLVACLLFKQAWGNFLPVYLVTVGINFPMAFFWQNFVAGPLVRKVYRLMFERS